MAREKRAWQPREMQMITEWLTRNFPDRRWKTRVRLGSPPEALVTPERRGRPRLHEDKTTQGKELLA